MTLLILGRFLSFGLLTLAATWAAVWMLRNRPSWPSRFPEFVLAGHGAMFYGVYLFVLLSPTLQFHLQTFADWGSIFIMHAGWYMLFSQIDEDTGFFSRTLPRMFLRLRRGA